MTPAPRKGSQVPDDAVLKAPLIFIAGPEDVFGLRKRIEIEGRLRSGTHLDVWHDDRLALGGQWTEEIDAALRRARVAVVLLSERYLHSKYSELELSKLDEISRISNLTIFAILLERCEWQRFELLRRSRVWDAKSPLSELPPATVEEELRRIVGGILQLAGLPDSEQTPPVKTRFTFSESAAAVVAKAEELAIESARKSVNCSCLLFGLSERAISSTDTSMFVKQALNVKGDYAAAFEQFLHDARTQVVGKGVEGLTSRFTPNAVAVLTSAENIANGTGSKVIHARHLFGALIGPLPQRNTAKDRIKKAGIEISQLVIEFLAFLTEYAPKDDHEKWREILMGSLANSSRSETPLEETPSELNRPESAEVMTARPEEPVPSPRHSSYVSGAPGYNAEFCGLGGAGAVADHLGVEDLAGHLAELICLQETRLPLAIGLFGNWGSGKSHFMNLIDRRIKSLTQEARETVDSQNPSAPPQSRWCREIVPIYFNAWHYSDSNLWASLVTEVFDALFAHIQPKEDELALLEDRLRKAGGVTSLAEEQLKIANDNVQKASRALESAIKDKKVAGRAVQALFEGLKTLIPELDTTQNRERVLDLLGVPPEDATLSELNAKCKELTSIFGRAKELWRRATNPKGLATRFGWLVGAVIAVGITHVIGLYVEQIKDVLELMGPWVRNTLIGLAGLAAWMTPVFRQVQASLSQLEKWQKRAELAQAAMPTDPRVVDAQNLKLHAEAKAITAEAALATAKSEELNLNQAIDSLRPERRLGRFIETRARSADYRGQLGLVSLARRDFNELSRIFTDAKSIKREMEDKPQQAEGIERLSLRVDRVVLFIDDLDRCAPENIVDVLQAVHLLLAYPLFAVIVGVDQRALRQSLRMRLKGLLAQNGEEMIA